MGAHPKIFVGACHLKAGETRVAATQSGHRDTLSDTRPYVLPDQRTPPVFVSTLSKPTHPSIEPACSGDEGGNWQAKLLLLLLLVREANR